MSTEVAVRVPAGGEGVAGEGDVPGVPAGGAAVVAGEGDVLGVPAGDAGVAAGG